MSRHCHQRSRDRLSSKAVEERAGRAGAGMVMAQGEGRVEGGAVKVEGEAVEAAEGKTAAMEARGLAAARWRRGLSSSECPSSLPEECRFRLWLA